MSRRAVARIPGPAPFHVPVIPPPRRRPSTTMYLEPRRSQRVCRRLGAGLERPRPRPGARAFHRRRQFSRRPWPPSSSPAAEGVIHGKAALRQYWGEGLRRIPDLHFEVVGVYLGVDVLVINYRNQRGNLVNEVLGFDGPGPLGPRHVPGRGWQPGRRANGPERGRSLPASDESGRVHAQSPFRGDRALVGPVGWAMSSRCSPRVELPNRLQVVAGPQHHDRVQVTTHSRDFVTVRCRWAERGLVSDHRSPLAAPLSHPASPAPRHPPPCSRAAHLEAAACHRSARTGRAASVFFQLPWAEVQSESWSRTVAPGTRVAVTSVDHRLGRGPFAPVAAPGGPQHRLQPRRPGRGERRGRKCPVGRS